MSACSSVKKFPDKIIYGPYVFAFVVTRSQMKSSMQANFMYSVTLTSTNYFGVLI